MLDIEKIRTFFELHPSPVDVEPESVYTSLQVSERGALTDVASVSEAGTNAQHQTTQVLAVMLCIKFRS